MTLKFIKEICKLGGDIDCCRYLLCDGEGFCCGKLSGFKSMLDRRVAKNEMHAKGDNCDGLPEKFREVHQEIYDKCIELQPKWKRNAFTLRTIIVASVTNGDHYKRITVSGKTYLVPIADVICLGVKAEEIPLKYKEAK
ncbi:MAG: hypothetical protein WC208_10335 [Gallionella sp.]|jgi:hypothetical protein